MLCHSHAVTKRCHQLRRASYCEIYNEGLHDLIRYNNRAQLPVRWDPGHGFHVPELAKVAAPTLQDMYKVCMDTPSCMHAQGMYGHTQLHACTGCAALQCMALHARRLHTLCE